MKTCPFCAEQIQDAAVVCRYCGRDLETKAVFPRAKGLVFDAKGDRYLVGKLIDQRGEIRQFCLWDAESPGPPIERFPLTKQGRESAAARFQELERGHTIIQNHEPPACPRCGWEMRRMDGSERAAEVVSSVVVFGILGMMGRGSRFACTNCGMHL